MQRNISEKDFIGLLTNETKCDDDGQKSPLRMHAGSREHPRNTLENTQGTLQRTLQKALREQSRVGPTDVKWHFME